MNLKLLVSALTLCALPAISSAAVMGLNGEAHLDFSNSGEDWVLETLTNGAPLTFELDGDTTNVGIANVSGLGQYRLLQEITAPAGYTMSNIKLTGKASGYGSWIMHGRASLDVGPNNVPLQNDYSVDGANLPGDGYADKPFTLDSSGNLEYTDITSVYVAVEIVKYLSNVWESNNVRELVVTADLTPVPEPASFGLLAAGGCLLLRRSRRQV